MTSSLEGSNGQLQPIGGTGKIYPIVGAVNIVVALLQMSADLLVKVPPLNPRCKCQANYSY